jgi:aminopeptidase N
VSRIARRSLAAGMLAAGLLTPSGAFGQSPGAPGLGDPYFPLAGNGGYQVDDYGLAIRFAAGKGRIRAVARINATSTQALSSFNLDLRGLRVRDVRVGGAPAGWSRKGAELTVVPATPIPAAARFEAVISYEGRPKPAPGPNGTSMGWNPSRGGAFVASEPRGAPTWFPCNDHPTDKATYTIAVTVPRGRTAVANGSLLSVRRGRGKTTFTWRTGEPMASYLATATTGRFRLRRSKIAGIPAWTAIDPRLERRSRRAVRLLPSITRRFSSYLGPYPFSSTGVIVDGGFDGYVLETQTRPLFGEAAKPVVMAHEIAHQWFGDSVTPERWSEIWLNEGFATWAEWFWQTGGRDRGLRKIFRSFYRIPGSYSLLWKVAPGDPGVRKLFSFSVYIRGGMTLEALRQLVGDAAFRATLRAWVSENRFGNASTADFVELAERASGRELGRFFDLWLQAKRKPRNWG